jgi:hypothetical protein
MVNWNVHGLAAENECRNNKKPRRGNGISREISLVQEENSEKWRRERRRRVTDEADTPSKSVWSKRIRSKKKKKGVSSLDSR